jgi:N-acetylmuramoyl-L-alanine amidase
MLKFLTQKRKHSSFVCVTFRKVSKVIAPFCWLLAMVTMSHSWEIIKFEGREFVKLEEVATFYQLGQPTSFGGNRIRLAGAYGSLTFSIGSHEADINGIRHWLCFPITELRGQPLLSRTDLSKTIEPLMRPERIVPRRRVETVIIDPGHGGEDHGARGRWTYDEKDLALESARHLKDELERDNLRTVLTRTRDQFVSLEDRARETQRHRNAIFVSLHFNHGGPNGRGTEVFAITPRGAPATMQARPNSGDFIRLSGHAYDTHSLLLADAIERRIAPLHGAENSRGVKRARFHVLRESWCPAVLVEGGFLSNRQDAARISRRDFTKRFAQAVRQGIRDYLESLDGRRSYTAYLP